MDQFNKVASTYAKFRPTYPETVYKNIQELGTSEKFEKTADIGCGAGHSIDGLKKISNDIVGVEPGDGLRMEAIQKYPEFEFVKGTGENTNLEDQSVNLITVATAFYWMDRVEAIEEFNRILKDDGALALYRYRFPRIASNKEVDDIVQKHCMDHWDQYRDERLVREDDSSILLEDSGFFKEISELKVENIWSLSVEGFVNFMTSTSYVSKYLESLGTESLTYVESLKNEIRQVVGDEELGVNFDIHMILAKKK